MQSWSESNRLHSSNRREDSARDALNEVLDNFDHDAFDEEMFRARLMDEDSDRVAAEFDAYEEAQLQKLDEIMDGDWPEHPLSRM